MFFWNATYWTPEGIKYNTIMELYKSEGILYLYFSSEEKFMQVFWASFCKVFYTISVTCVSFTSLYESFIELSHLFLVRAFYIIICIEIEAFWLLHHVFQIVLGDWKLPHLFFSVQAVVRVVSVQCETWEVWFNIHYH